MTCVKCGRPIADDRVRVAIMLGDGRAALDWACFEALLRPGRVAELLRLVRYAAPRARAGGAGVTDARGERYEDKPD
jgi:hypothetical protein